MIWQIRQILRKCWKPCRRIKFKDFLPADKAPQVREVLSTEGSVSARNGKGGTSPLRVREQIVSAKTTIEQLRAFANSVSDGSAYKSPESLLK